MSLFPFPTAGPSETNRSGLASLISEQERYQARRPDELTLRQASEAIDDFKAAGVGAYCGSYPSGQTPVNHASRCDWSRLRLVTKTRSIIGPRAYW
jgi:hypothetical protein